MADFENDEILKYAIEHDMIDMSYMQQQIEMNKRQELLEKHPYSIWEGKDGNWYTHLPDEKKGRILRKRKTQDAIENVVCDYGGEERKRSIFRYDFTGIIS